MFTIYCPLQFDSTLSKMEAEFELQSKITAAYLKLSKDSAVSKSIRRDRQHCYRKAYSKVCMLEGVTIA